jgi:predicted transposase YbfD/YdcC
LTVAPDLLAKLPLAGRLVTGDALYCQRVLCQTIIEAGGDYLLFVKANQPTLEASIQLLFAAPPPGERFTFVEVPSQHGNRHEVRRLWASTALAAYLDWPGVQQVAKVERTVTPATPSPGETRYLITSLGPRVGPRELLREARGHWAIENRLHYVRDVTFGEDASTVRKGSGPEVLAALRNAVLALLRAQGYQNVAAGLRQNSWQPGTGLRLLGLTPE